MCVARSHDKNIYTCAPPFPSVRASFVCKRALSLRFLRNPEWEIDSARVFIARGQFHGARRNIKYYTLHVLLSITRYHTRATNDIIIYASERRRTPFPRQIPKHLSYPGVYSRRSNGQVQFGRSKRLNARIMHASLSKVPPQAGLN